MTGYKQIKIGAILSYIAIMINIITGLFYTPWMIDSIGKSQYGLYTLANSLISLFLVDFGLSSATARYLAKYNAENNQEASNCFLGAIYKMYIVIDLIISIAFLIIFLEIDSIYVSLSAEEITQFKFVFILSAGYSIVSFPFVTLNGILTAYEKFIAIKVVDIVYRVFNVVFTIFALTLNGGLYSIVLIHCIVGGGCIALKLLIIKLSLPIKINFRKGERQLYGDILSFSAWVTVASLSQRLVFNITPSILGIVANATEIAVFGVVIVIEGYTYLIATAMNGMFLPEISKIVVDETSRKKLSKLLLYVGKYQYAINGLIIVGFALIGKEFIQLWMNDSYTNAYYGIMFVIVPGLFFNSLQIANTTLVVESKVRIQGLLNLMTGIINVTLSFWLSNLYGAIGACISICIAYSFRSIVMNIISQVVLGLDMITFIKQCYIRMSFPIIVTFILGLKVKSLFQTESWASLIISGCIITVIYTVLVFSFGLKKSEANMALSILRRKK